MRRSSHSWPSSAIDMCRLSNQVQAFDEPLILCVVDFTAQHLSNGRDGGLSLWDHGL